jgi:hypothetical protein
MGVKFKGNLSSITKEAERQYQAALDGMIEIMQYVGEEFMTDAKKALRLNKSLFPKGNYQDQTANLRSSIGYFILLNGRVITSKTEGNSEGTDAAKSMLQQVQKGGLQLVGVAGMDYALKVESKGYNVITSQKEVAIVDLTAMLKEYAAKRGISVSTRNPFKTQTL